MIFVIIVSWVMYFMIFFNYKCFFFALDILTWPPFTKKKTVYKMEAIPMILVYYYLET